MSATMMEPRVAMKDASPRGKEGREYTARAAGCREHRAVHDRAIVAARRSFAIKMPP
ncbi:hypothetical protein [Burkholderia latens]|uniref:hypothetical protein n=1 Tax=Burkholderia latens TaxID=488446 RepID=UPI001478FB50|nr:hypothetical protein [Burkholderia latens]